ncbi:cupin domain-containing protein [Acinetobacter sp. YH16032]|uniref:cupin domain-containing protein n=1 Tax=Acinetobacter sp. YH16032 TaxID=2601181 RepID=UPI0015D1699C|nr:cupin domain-containing protein [Acinetobacter sp. YH16032]
MRLNADFSQPVIITPEDYQWIQSPRGEVKRMMFDRVGLEQARATSLVEFPSNSQFREHQHPFGEEVLVLKGTFTEDDHQHYPSGWYMRNPHLSKHIVSSVDGCLILVKLMQMSEEEKLATRIDTRDERNWTYFNNRKICQLFQSEYEDTFLEKLESQQVLESTHHNGIEIFIIKGKLVMNERNYSAGSWIRFPIQHRIEIKAGGSGALIYVKKDHLKNI